MSLHYLVKYLRSKNDRAPYRRAGGIKRLCWHCGLLDGAGESSLPRIVHDKSTQRMTATEGSDLALECAAEGFPVPHVNWEKYGGQLPAGRYSVALGLFLLHIHSDT